MKKNFIFSIILLSSILVISSCAAIIHGSRQAVEFNSRPTGAKLYVDGQDIGVTPQTLDLKRNGKGKKQYTVKIELQGYQPYETTLIRKLDGWLFGNLVFGGIVGIVIDIATGSMYKLTPKRVDGDFQNSTTSAKSGKNGIYVDVTLKPDPSWEKIGQLTKLSK